MQSAPLLDCERGQTLQEAGWDGSSTIASIESAPLPSRS